MLLDLETGVMLSTLQHILKSLALTNSSKTVEIFIVVCSGSIVPKED